ncbi:MAG: metalloregulator ArsR/SmtB family transcription factor [Anaerolineae bacterium]|nr:metalloregulator ArsR/SmtB family transcription factor [Anaerolineae bacterium]MCO5186642.1 metalloregulator ArsR/SmtB family transcription factor [Anaerolineae bacterium]MCO5195773.1 metalloregulator ArsR/SmtB family transcription factor [Anaerolineae bacterium]MCO5198021.1 metalloregulator ArsR/SmtB family transcription factor [Anaerolineae bacterium]MCO5206115.1 metalloregulator ArsR/SmtB family transcription factor [Anaerolineae bacterium]
MTAPTLDELSLLHANICQALGDPKRIQILYALYEQPLHVTALADYLDTPQPTISRHLRVLRQRALVTTERNGAAVVYRLTDERMIAVLETMRKILRDSLSRQSNVLNIM